MDSREGEALRGTIGRAATVGLGWGLVFGLVDGLAALLEGDPSVDLGRRLLALTYVAAFDAAAFGLVLAATGGLVWAVLRAGRRRGKVAGLAGLYAGLCAALSVAGYVVHRYPGGPWPVTLALALGGGLGAGWLVQAGQRAGVSPVRRPERRGRMLGRRRRDSSLATLVQNDRVGSSQNDRVESGQNDRVESGQNDRVGSGQNDGVGSGQNDGVGSGQNDRVGSGQNDRVGSGWKGGISGSRVVVGILAVCVVVLVGRGLYHEFGRDLPFLNPRVTGQVATPERPNVVLISIDALRADGLGVYGNDPAASPRIDALARQGIVFQQATSQGSSTVPSVSSFLTSLYPTEIGMVGSEDRVVDELRVTLAEALQAAGYRTQAYVTNGHLVPARGYAQGFDDYARPEPGRPYGLDRLRAETVVAGLACRSVTAVCDLFDAGYRLMFDRMLVMEDEGGRVNDQAQRFIRLHAGEQFFLWLHYMEPHAAYRPRQAFGDLPASVSAERESLLREWQPSNKTTPTVLRPDDVRAVRALYDGEVREVDGWVGDIWDEIQAAGLADRTLLVLTADHGDEFGEHGDFGHGHTVYQDLNRVPLIVVGPQVATAGRVVEGPVPLLDIMPTLIDVAGAPRPDLMRGQSLLPVLQGGEPPERAIISESPASRSKYDDKSLRRGDYKLVYNVKLDRAELYDLKTDPGEAQDLAAAEPERVAAMRDELRAWTVDALETWASLPQSGREAGEMDAALEDALREIGY